ncbi:MAG: hypothetical protein IT323_14740, partial [Anaerolineae bacterium]|nr:hypothetical protein [Anaerolineae bacterium]
MSNERFEALRKQLGQARRERDSLDDERQAALGRLKAVEARLAALRRAGKDNENDGQGAGALRERAALEQEIRRLDAAQTERRRVADGLAAEFGRLFASPEEQLARLDDANPILLLPVRLETRFMPAANGTELWVRIFPDDVAIDSHQPGLTPDEIVAGKSYWEQFWRAGDDGARQRGAWRVLVNRCGRHRAAWIARSLTPANPGDRPAAPVPDDQPLSPPPAFPEPPPSPALWSRAPHSRVMPDRFVILTYQGGVANPPVLGAPIPDPLIVGPDPLAAQPSLEQLGDKLVVDASFAWLTDFEAAVKIGMGLKIPLTPAQARAGFDRVLCLGIRFADDAREGAATLESLLDAHHYASGFALVPQGTPTNNTEDAPSGVAREDADADTSFDVEQGAPLFTPLPANDPARSDGQRLAEALGVRPDVLQHIQHSNREDGREARAMNTALFPATLGYFMEEMMHPVFDLDAIRKTRAFFIEFVSARGALPAIRIGKQPYGVLPTTAFSRLNVRGLMRDAFPVQLQAVLRRMEQTWNDLKAQVKHAGSGGDPEETFLNILGLQPATAELHKRGALDDDVAWNYAIFLGLGANSTHWWENLKLLGELLVSSLGYDFAETPKIFKMSFLENHRVLDGPWVDDAPLAEEKPVRPLPAQALNYIGWLAQAKLDDVRDQRLGLDAEGKPIPPPRALLYLLLRHALLLEYWDTSMKFYVRENVVPLAARREVTTINLQGARESTRWDYLDAALPQVTGNRKMSEFLDLSTLAFVDQVEVQELREVGDALRLLANLPTARLERLLAEHLALVSYRLDAWQMGLLNLRMRAMGMAAPPTLTHAAAAASARTGTYLGMYGWLENLRPAAPRQRVPRREIPEGFDEPGAPPLVYAPDNAGHVHMPSIAHAGTAAVLLNAHLTHAGPDNNRPFSVNLSSERTRRALWFFEGILNGQDLGALLGYQFERGLHERHPGLELDQFILPIRQKYPIAVDPKKDTPPGASSEAIAARDVLDGEALLRKGGAYPYQVAGLPPAASPEGRAIQNEVERLGDSLDAVGDLALSEGVFQVLRGNFDRGGAILEGINRGAFFQEPEVVRTPRSGTGLTHRLAIAFDMNSPAANPWPAVPMTPRALAEPRLNHWIGVLLGAPEDIRCLARFRSNPDDPFSLPRELSLADLAVQPLDVMYLSLSDLADEGTELEKRLAFVLRAREGLHTQVELRLDFIARDGGWGVGVKT